MEIFSFIIRKRIFSIEIGKKINHSAYLHVHTTPFPSATQALVVFEIIFGLLAYGIYTRIRFNVLVST